MADTALKFGPEWLRALTEPQGGLSSCGGGGGPPLTHLKRPEFRYGREEMLDIFHRETKPPEDLSAFGSLYVEACQLPMNLMQMSEEEIRAWQRGANSDAGVRPYGPPGGGKRPPSPVGRGRGRGRGGTVSSAHPHYDRNRSVDDEFDGVSRGYGGLHATRGRSSGIYERQTSERGGGWFDQGLERNSRGGGGVDDELAGGGSGSPRKGYTRAPFDDWRGMRAGGEGADYKGGEDGWRTSGTARSKWSGGGPAVAGGAPNTWRTGDRDSGPVYGRGGKYGDSREMGRGGGGSSERWRRDDDKTPPVVVSRPGGGPLAGRRMRNDHLPEWAMEEAAGGSFDDSGKFRAEQNRLNGTRNAGEEWEDQERWEDEEVDPDDIAATGGGGGGMADTKKTGGGKKSPSREKEQQQEVKAGSEEKKPLTEPSSSAKSSDLGVADSSSGGGVGAIAAVRKEERTAATAPLTVGHPAGQTHKSASTISSSSGSAAAVVAAVLQHQTNSAVNSGGGGSSSEDLQPRNDHMETMAGNLVSSLVDEDEPEVVKHQQSSSTNSRHHHLDQSGGGGFAAAFNMLAPPALPPPPAEPSWTYLDPQGQIQGPFQSEEMLEWYTGGYFPADLMVKRQEDATFLSLTEVTKLYSRCPFTPGPQPPPFSDLEERMRQEQIMRLHQQVLLQQQLMAQQQQQQQLLAMQQQRPDLNKLLSLRLGGLASHGDLIGGYGGVVDPLRSLLGSLGVATEPEPQPDPIKQFLARGAAASQPGGGLDLRNNTHQTVSHGISPSFDQSGGLFGPQQQQQPEYQHHQHHTSVLPPPPLPIEVPEERAAASPAAAEFDPIQSLLQQLQSSRAASSSSSSPQLAPRAAGTTAAAATTSQKIHTVPEQTSSANHHHEYFNKSNQFEKPVSSVITSIWDRPSVTAVTASESIATSTAVSASPWNTEPSPERAEPPAAVTASSTPAGSSISADRTPSPQGGGMDDPKLVAPSAVAAVPEEEVAATFETPKQNEKKEKRSKKAEEKRRAKEAKKQNELASSMPYIPGMPGSVQPEEQVVVTQNVLDQREEEKWRAQQEELAQQRAQMEALARLQEEQRARLRREEAERIRDEKLAKLAPWAKVKEEEAAFSPTNTRDQKRRELTLQEIQRMEAEKERVEREARELAEAQAREEARRREEEERARRAAKQANWALAVAPSSAAGPAKSLAEIQAEEARVERERQERERSQRLKESGLSAQNGGGSWKIGGGGGGTSWAGKIAANAGNSSPAVNRVNPPGGSGANPWSSVNGTSAVNIVAPEGFWEPVIPPSNLKKQQQQHNNNNNNNNSNSGNNNNNPKKKGKKEGKQGGDKANNSRSTAERNEFEDWCTGALESLQAQVDIPTFLTFLRDIESPYEVHDYVKSYVGDGKPQKKFAMEYLERRSRWKNALKSGGKYEDDLTTPALALSPGDGEFQEAGKKGKKKTNKASRSNLNHLLGFSVQGQGVNRGELDVPQ